MKILILSQYFYPEVGATQTRMYEFARHLASRGHQVTVVCEFPNHPHGRIPASYRGRWFEEESRDGFRVVRVWVWASPVKNFRTRMLFYISYLLMAALRSLRLPRPDVILATSPPLFTAVAGYLVSSWRRRPFVMDVRDLWPAAAVALGELRNPRLVAWAEKVERFLYRKAALITAVTQGFRKHIEDLGVSPGKIAWVPNGTIITLFKPGPGSLGFRRETGMEERFLVTFAGTQGIAQGLQAVLEAAELARDDSSVGFVFIGDGPVREELLRRKEAKKLSNVYFRDQVPLEEVAPLLNASDALLVCLRQDPVFDTFIPSKLFDSMACGKPVLLGVNGEAAEILEEAGAGLHFQPENPEALLAAVRRLRDDPLAAREMGRRGRAFVERKFDRKRQAAQLERLLLGLSER